jgi:hypothetical protein
MTTAYRSVDPILQERLTQLRARRVRERDDIDAARRVLAARVGLALAGGTTSAFGILMFLSAAGPWKGAATLLLGGGWVAGGVTMALGRAWVLSREARALEAGPALTGDAHVDLAHLDGFDPRTELRERARRWERASATYPLVGLAIVAPLTLHGVVGVLGGAHEGTLGAEQFGAWIGLSAVFAGLAHVALGVHCAVWARALRSRPTASLRLGVRRAWMTALALAVAGSLAPGALLAADVGIFSLLPALIVAVTGLAFVPLMYWATARRIAGERARLGD